MTLTDFLLARIAEDETEVELGASRFNPERVWAECEAKRRIVKLHLPSASHRWCISCTDIDTLPPNNVEAFPCRTLRALAAVYADHADYRDEWQPYYARNRPHAEA